MSRFRKTPLVNRWLHSHEEDPPAELVYRPAGFPFPQSQSRSGFELRPQGTLIRVITGTENAADVEDGIWVLEEGRQPKLILEWASGTQQEMEIVSADDEKLVLREKAGQSKQ